MPDSIGTGEDLPVGKIVILTDRNGDGKMDERKIFLDSLVLPRAICFIENGILVAESPNLWFYEIKNDKPLNKTLVDAAYAEGGNAVSYTHLDVYKRQLYQFDQSGKNKNFIVFRIKRLFIRNRLVQII